MGKNYADQLGEWVKQRESNKREKNVVAFLAVRDDIKLALDAGFAVKTIWTNMHEKQRVAFGYDTFLIYVRRYIRRHESKEATTNTQTGAAAPARHPPQAAVESRAIQHSRSKALGPLPGFTFNSDPRKEDLL